MRRREVNKKIDIVVTIPKSEYKNNDLEDRDIKEKGYSAFWTLSRTPKNLCEGDRVYFVKDSKIYSSMKVIEIIQNSRTACETTGREWSGDCQIFMDDFKIENLDIQIKGFQGFRYKWWED